MSFVATQIDVDIIVLSKSDSKREISYIAYMWDLKKNDTNELIYRAEIESQA